MFESSQCHNDLNRLERILLTLGPVQYCNIDTVQYKVLHVYQFNPRKVAFTDNSVEDQYTHISSVLTVYEKSHWLWKPPKFLKIEPLYYHKNN